jgi:hypothetical protein
VLLIAIFVDPPAKLGPEVDAWIERLVGDGPLACVEPAPWESDDWDLVARAAAGRLLLAEHSRAPIDDWVHGRVDLPDSRSPRTRDKTHPWPEEVLLEHLRTDAAALDHGWHEGCDGPKRDVLLRLGEREPRDWFFHAALGERGPVRLVWADKHQADPRVVPLLRALYREASNASGRAYWAILLHRHERWCHEIVGELRSWACDDQEPFSDDWAVESLFHFDASWASGSDSYVIRGGWRAMLHLLTLIQAERTDDWIRPGVKRLWEKVRAPGRCLRAPSSDAEERHVTLRTPYDDLYDEQGVLMTLLHRLGEFEVLDRFIDASGDAPEPGDGRQEAFDQWRAHATSAQLHRALDASDWRAECVAATLAERGDPAGPDWACRTLAAAEAWDDDLTGTLSWLAVHAPARMLEAIDDLFRRLPKGRHALRVWLTAFLPALGAHERGARMFLRQSFS